MHTGWVVRCILAVIFTLLFLSSVRKERRRYRNAIFLGGAIHSLLYAVIEFTLPQLPLRIVRMNVYIFSFMIVTILGALALYIDSLKLLKREGFGRTALLPAFAATCSLLLTLAVFLLARFAYDILPLRILALTGIFILFFNSFVLLTLIVYTITYSLMPVRTDYDYIIIHGAGLLDGHRISKLLASRIDKAIEVYERCGHRAKLIPSGGKGDDEDLSEAEAIRGYLLEKGISPEDILIENRSTTTMENLRYSKALIEAQKPAGTYKCIFVTSNYHVLRTAIYARKAGLSGECVGARTRMYYWISAFLREYAAILAANKLAAMLWILLWWGWFLLENT